MSECRITPPENFSELVVRLKEVFESDKIDVDYVTELMNSYKSNPAEWEQYAQFDKYRYTRNLVDEGNGKFNLIVLCWNEGQGSSIHDHDDSHCFLKVLDGKINEVMFNTPENEGEELHEREAHIVPLNKTAYICNDIGIHRVENPSYTDKAVSLHLYSPPLLECGSYDQRTGHKNICKMTFFSKAGKRTPFKVEKTDDKDGEVIQTGSCHMEDN